MATNAARKTAAKAKRPTFNPATAGHRVGATLASATSAAGAARDAFNATVSAPMNYDTWQAFSKAVWCEVARVYLARMAESEKDRKRREALEGMAQFEDEKIAYYASGRNVNLTIQGLRKGACESALQMLRKCYREKFATTGKDGKRILADVPKKSAGLRSRSQSENQVLTTLHSTLEALAKKTKHAGEISADIMAKLAKLAADAAELDNMVRLRIEANRAADSKKTA
jgi:hypothetical protein